MGNGASIPQNPSSNPSEYLKGYQLSHSDYMILEKRCKSGYYKRSDNHVEYKEAFRNAILYEAIDIVEILIIYGDTKTLNPLHIASELGAIDSLEILLSAGFDWSSVDRQGQTPLHYCSKLDTGNASLCTTLLCLQGKKRIINIKDKNGNEAIHIAVLNNNINVTRTLLEYGANINSPNKEGKTAKDIAYNLKLNNIISLFKSNGVPASSKKESRPIDSERIMAVWEKFFENAMKQFDSEINADDSMLYDYNGINSALTSVSGNYSNTKSQKVKSIGDINTAIIEWFDWVLCYSEVESTGYYFINKRSGISRWFDEHCQIQRRLGIYEGYKKDPNNYPSTVQEAIRNGYCTYYDKSNNRCYWFDLSSYNLSLCLPIGLDPVSTIMNLFNRYEGDEEWLESDNTVASSWILVVLTDEEIEQIEEEYKETSSKKVSDWDVWDNKEYKQQQAYTCYYCNRKTGINIQTYYSIKFIINHYYR